jgi:hypothetical protein
MLDFDIERLLLILIIHNINNILILFYDIVKIIIETLLILIL